MYKHVIIALVLMAGIGNFASAQEVKPTTTPAVVKQDVEDQLDISASDNRIKVINAPIGSKLEIFSPVGIKVKEIEMKEASGEYPLNIAKGIYIVRIGEVVRKLVIR